MLHPTPVLPFITPPQTSSTGQAAPTARAAPTRPPSTATAASQPPRALPTVRARLHLAASRPRYKHVREPFFWLQSENRLSLLKTLAAALCRPPMPPLPPSPPSPPPSKLRRLLHAYNCGGALRMMLACWLTQPTRFAVLPALARRLHGSPPRPQTARPIATGRRFAPASTPSPPATPAPPPAQQTPSMTPLSRASCPSPLSFCLMPSWRTTQ